MASGRDIFWIETARQRLGLVPALGGGVAEWSWLVGSDVVHLWRPWDRTSEDCFSLASFAMLPWCNRISRGGFLHGGRWLPMAPNRHGEPYPIHGDGWLQGWSLESPGPGTAELRLDSRRHEGNPYEYDALQRFELIENGLIQTVTVTHRGGRPLPYGLGLHPWFPRTPHARVQANVTGVWLTGDDPIPNRYSTDLPVDGDLNAGAGMDGPMLDNTYVGWDGRASIQWPERDLTLEVVQDSWCSRSGAIEAQFCLMYRPPAAATFCFEPMTQAADAFRLAGCPGLVELGEGETLILRVHWLVHGRGFSRSAS